ncbi:MAG: DUF3859 domain-containing protein [Bacteroidales bacterium]
MAKKKIDIKIKSYGIYTQWDRSSKDLPKLRKVTTDIPAELDVEFGYILQIKGGKGTLLDFIIKHPPFMDLKTGQPAADFVGEHFVNSNDWMFFLGDTIWEPVEDKKGIWEIVVYMNGKEVANKKFIVA